MELYSENENYKLYHGNMLDMLEVVEPNSIDSIVTDPPYGLTSITKRFGKENSAECQYGKDGSFQRLSKGFMGKEWDGSGIEYNIDTWRKCYEVLKSGGYLLAFGGSRTFHRIACAIEDAGFEIRDTIMWLYGSGFPKSMDISKSLDKRNGRNPNIDFKNYLNEKRKEKGYSLADINKLMNVATNGGGFASSIMGEKDNIILPTKENYLKLKKILDLDNRYDELINISEAERKIVGEKVDIDGKPRSARYVNKCENASAWNLLDTDEKLKKATYLTAPSTELAKQWQGWGTALKPSFEPIIVARKPFKGSLVDNVIEYGVGGLNIDECRVPFINDKDNTLRPTGNKQYFGLSSNINMIGGEKDKGRFPANTILTYDETDFDEVCGGFPDTNKSKGVTSNKGTYWGGNNENTRNKGYEDNGSASRYFYCAKASKKDRDEGLDNQEEQKVNDGRQTPIDNPFQRGETPRKNTHPTVKPTSLMQYLVRLVTPNGGTILDPFNGSGSTGKAVMYENLERDKKYKYVGIELTEEYLPISKARIEYVCNLPKKQRQADIFDYLGDDDE